LATKKEEKKEHMIVGIDKGAKTLFLLIKKSRRIL
jgi:hypothetical protein